MLYRTVIGRACRSKPGVKAGGETGKIKDEHKFG